MDGEQAPAAQEFSEEQMRKEIRKDVMRRLLSAEGHTRGVTRMVETDEDCLAVVRQVNAIQGALDKVGQIVMQEHLMTCLTDSHRRENPNLRKELIDELADLFFLSQDSKPIKLASNTISPD